MLPLALLLALTAIGAPRAEPSVVDPRAALEAEWALYREGDFEGALAAFQRAAAQADDRLLVAEALTGSSSARSELGQIEAAFADLDRALALRIEVLGEVHPVIVRTLLAVAAGERSAGRSERALATLERAAVIQARLPPDPEAEAQLAGQRGATLHELGRYDEALVLLSEALSALEAAPARARVELWVFLSEVQRRKDDLDGAERSLLEALALTDAHGTHASTRGKVLNNLGSLLRGRGDNAGARLRFAEAIEALEEAMGPEHSMVALACNNLAVVEVTLGHLDAGRALLERSLEIQRSLYGDQHPSVASIVENLATIAHMAGDREEAIARLRESLALREAVLGPGHSDVAISLRNLAAPLSDMHRFDEALPYLERALRIVLDNEGPHSVQAAAASYALGQALSDVGEDVRARRLHERALAVREDLLGPDHPDVGSSAAELGRLLLHFGDLDGAAEYLSRGIAIREAALGPDHRLVGTALGNLALVHRSRGDLDRAATLTRRALAVARASEHPDPVEVSAFLHNLGAIALSAGDPQAALVHTREGRALVARAYGETHRWVAKADINLSGIHLALGDLEAARATATAALDVLQRDPGASSLLTEAQRQLAEVHLARGDRDAAGALMDALYAAWTGSQADLLQSLSERGAMALLDARREELETWLEVYGGHDDARAWDGVLLWKNAVGRMARGRHPADPEAARELMALRREIARLSLDTTASSTRLANLILRKEQLEATSTAHTSRADPTTADVCGVLEGGTVLVDFLRTSERFEAFVVTGGEGCAVRRVDLGPAAVVEDRIDAWREALAGRGPDGAPLPTTRVDQRGLRARVAILDPLALPDGTRHLVVVPDAALASVPFSAFPMDDERYLVERVGLTTVESATRLLDAPGPSGRGALVVGGVAFGADGTAPDRAGCFDRDFAPLPGTAREVDALAARWSRRRGDEPLIRLGGAEATEARVLDAIGGRRVVHLATHGFFAGSCAGAHRTYCDHPGLQCGSPMALSGVALAGAAAPRDPYALHDGILTAEEVRGLALDGTELVVLSACETALGEVRPGEGVLGMQRALTGAGARSLVLSLWPVDDGATVALMDEMYRRALRGRGPLDAGDALRRAQLELLSRQRQTHGEGRPGLWAAFVALGPSGP